MALWERERTTLVVENDALRMMSVLRGVVTRWGSVPLPRDALAPDGSVANPELLVQILKRLWSVQGAGRTPTRENLVLAIPGHHVPTRLVPLPEGERMDRAMLGQRAREALPQPDAYHAWQMVNPTGRAGLFVVAAPASLVEGYVSVLERTGLGVAAIDLKPFALIRAVGYRHTVIVDVEQTRVATIIVDEALPRRVHFSSLEAPLLAPVDEKITRVVEILYETLSLYNEENPGHPLHPAVPIHLSGSLGEHPLLRESIRTVLGHPVGHSTPPIQIPPDMPLGQFLANVGLIQKRL